MTVPAVCVRLCVCDVTLSFPVVPTPVVEVRSQAGFLSFQSEKASSKECGIPGESDVHLAGWKRT